MTDSVQDAIFKNGSTTYYFASRFFPKKILKKVEVVYAFVRIIDDLVDQSPPKVDQFQHLKLLYGQSRKGKSINNRVIADFVSLERQLSFEPDWVRAFFDSMQMDIVNRKYKTLSQVEEYIYGSAEVVGLMMAKILDLPPQSYLAAQQLGKAMQWANFIRDINEDFDLGRCYFPATVIRDLKIKAWDRQWLKKHPQTFASLVTWTCDIYFQWQQQAQAGFNFIPNRLLIPIASASQMYTWTVDQINNDPSLVFERKIKPSKWQVLFSGILQTFKIYSGGYRVDILRP